MAQFLSHHQHHDPGVGEVPVPHGPATGDETEDFPREGQFTAEEEHQIFNYLVRPDDSFDENGVYWADLKWGKRIAFVNKVNNAEAAKELGTIWSMMKKNPLSPIGWYMRNAVLPGAGLGLEGYVLFSIGNLAPLFSSAWPQCWGSKATECSVNWNATVTYLEVIGIMVGQVTVGVSTSPPPLGYWRTRHLEFSALQGRELTSSADHR